MPWDRGGPHRMLVGWARERGISGTGHRALVVGCGLGDDAEYIAGLGFGTVAFDISASAIRAARRRYPGSNLRYVVADLLDPPADGGRPSTWWWRASPCSRCLTRRGGTPSPASGGW